MDPMTDLANNFSSSVRLTDDGSVGNLLAEGPTSTPRSTFEWKVDAPEFVPRCSASNTVASNSEVSASHWATSTIQNDPSSTDSMTLAQPYFDGSLSQDASSAADRLTLLYQNVDWIVSELQNTPENFDHLAAQFLKFLQVELQPPLDPDGAVAIFDSLLDAALFVPNFAYLCVRLMTRLHDRFFTGDQAVSAGQPRNQCWFRDALLDSLENEFTKQKTVLQSEEIGADQTQRVFLLLNTLCMFATLLNRNGRPYTPLSRANYELLECMVKRRSDAFVRVAIQTLKTIGAHLEATEKMNSNGKTSTDSDKSTPLMDKLIDVLECIAVSKAKDHLGTENTNANTLSENTRFMIRNLRGVRRHWAYVAPPPPSPVQVEPVSNSSYYTESQVPPLNNNCPADYLETVLPPYENNSSCAYYEVPYLANALYYSDASLSSPMMASGLVDAYTPSAASSMPIVNAGAGCSIFLTTAEAAFFEAAASDVDDDFSGVSVVDGTVAAGSRIRPPSLTSTSAMAANASALPSDDDLIADAYEEFLRNMQERQTPPQRHFRR